MTTVSQSFGNKNKYQTLIDVLDRLRLEAPREFKRYYPLESDIDKVNNARARTFIHLYLKVKFGLLDFIERENNITDGTQDGGVDAYYIDSENKVIYFIQSKFRTTEKNFHNKEIELKELLNMEIGKITEGEKFDDYGKRFNGKILKLIDTIADIDDMARYKYQIVILANLSKISSKKIRRIFPGYPVQVFDFDKCYQDLIFPVVTGTYYNESDLFININLTNKNYNQSRINYPVNTENIDCEITILFVPTIEIAKVMHKYKNTILKYNPRSYLDLSKNTVNKEIAKSIEKKRTNEFALFNNGITILSDDTSLNEKIGQKDKGQLHLKNPQIINGGQTAFTLSKIYEDYINVENHEELFFSKEVMLKIITFTNKECVEKKLTLSLIEEISIATNQQTAVNDADRRSNDRVQIELQQAIFERFGFFYERKRGEFNDGLRNNYIDKAKVVDREILIRVCNAMSGLPAQGRRSSEKSLFKKESIDKILNDDANFTEMFFAYMCYKHLEGLQNKFKKNKNNKYGVINYGNALRYGKLAVIYATFLSLNEEMNLNIIEQFAGEKVDLVLKSWLDFEEYIKKLPHNDKYFNKVKDINTGEEILETNFDGYYKGTTLNSDVKLFFQQLKSMSFKEAAAGKSVT